MEGCASASIVGTLSSTVEELRTGGVAATGGAAAAKTLIFLPIISSSPARALPCSLDRGRRERVTGCNHLKEIWVEWRLNLGAAQS